MVKRDTSLIITLNYIVFKTLINFIGHFAKAVFHFSEKVRFGFF